ncbi:MAG: hypothetical protein AAFN92_03210, partial [Bacteroidota bacterium]
RVATLTLLLLNFVLLGFLFLGSKPPPKSPPSVRANERFDLDPEQHERFLQSADVHRAEMRRISAEQRQLLREYFGTLGLTTHPTSLPERITELEAEKITGTYDHLLRVKQLLRPDQLKEFPRFMEHVQERILGKREKKPRAPRKPKEE